MLEINVIKTDDVYYLSSENTNGYGKFNLFSYLFDGIKPSTTFHNNWVCVKQLPKKISQFRKQSNINYRYELIDKSLKSDKFPLVFLREEVAYLDDDEYQWIWKDEYSQYRSLYREISDKQPDKEEEIEFKLNIVLELEKIDSHNVWSYTTKKTQLGRRSNDVITQDDVQHQLIDKIIFPDIVLPDKPCRLSSIQTYDIIRNYIKENINGKYAEITSDYDFCFTVEKKISLDKPEKYSIDVNNNIFSKRKRKPKYETRYRKTRSVKIFSMTNDKDKYKGYPVIEGFQGKNHTDLKSKIDKYLEELIEFINKPLVDCPECKGHGIILDSLPIKT